MLSSDIPSDDPQQRQQRIRRLVAGAFVLLFIAMVSVTTLDSVGHSWVSCQVVRAEGQRGDQNSASAWVVVIDTQDCGRLVYVEGVNRDNVDQQARGFAPGEYELKRGSRPSSPLGASSLV